MRSSSCSGLRPRSGWFERALLAVLGPIAAAFVHLLLSPRRELAADRMASALLGSGEGLADALLKLDRASDLVSFQASPATEPLYTVNPFAEEGLAALFVTHPPLQTIPCKADSATTRWMAVPARTRRATAPPPPRCGSA